MNNHTILGIHVTNRLQHAGDVQKTLTEYGAYIKTRLGLHDSEGDLSSPGGLLLLELVGPAQKGQELMKRLSAVEGVEVQQMTFGDRK